MLLDLLQSHLCKSHFGDAVLCSDKLSRRRFTCLGDTDAGGPKVILVEEESVTKTEENGGGS